MAALPPRPPGPTSTSPRLAGPAACSTDGGLPEANPIGVVMPGQSSSQFLMIGLLAMMFGLMWWSGNRTRRQQREAADMRENLTPGTRVMTGSGAFGTVQRIEGDRVFLEMSPGLVTEWLLQAIAKVDEPIDVVDDSYDVPDDLSALEDSTDPDDPAR
ncbi:hypothetical protein SDC9_201669 [bioreactor metagenome]|uniref:Sec translocon accessory complex subunit YajC n=1 Tax=bioreactor metagenome TaxID=1076179 RepID=A0A645ISS6_9ZZZZ